MYVENNPFTPSFGEIPLHMAGREDVVTAVVGALESSRRRPELSTIFSGARGTGKTALLSLIAQKASERGWIVASATALPGMLDDIEIQARRGAAHLVCPQGEARVTGFGIPQVIEVEVEPGEPVPSNWRSRMSELLESLETHGAGLLISVDEVDADLDEMVQLAAVYQHFIREGRKVALFMAGLPHNVSSLVSHKSVSFLRRAELVQLGRIDDYEIEHALRRTICDNGRTADDEGLAMAVRAIDGFPFMMQLVGYRAWNESLAQGHMSTGDFERGIALARNDMRKRILDATYRDLSERDVQFLEAMVQDEGNSRAADLVERLGWSSSLVAQYRRRLIDAGVIGERSRGVVGFDMPFFAEYVRERAGWE